MPCARLRAAQRLRGAALRAAAGAPGRRVAGLGLRDGFLDGSSPTPPGPYARGPSFHSYGGKFRR